MIMRIPTTFMVVLATAALVVGCQTSNHEIRKTESFPLNDSSKNVQPEQNRTAASRGSLPNLEPAPPPPSPRPAKRSLDRGGATEIARGGGGGGLSDSVEKETVSLASISTVYAATEAIDRKIIRNADLTLETE